MALARNAGVDLHKLRRVERLSCRDRRIASAIAVELMDAEAVPRDFLNVLAGKTP